MSLVYCSLFQANVISTAKNYECRKQVIISPVLIAIFVTLRTAELGHPWNFIHLVRGFIVVAIGKIFVLCVKEPIRCIPVYVLYCIVQDDNRACKFFKWLDTSICCTRGAAIAPIVIAKFNWLKHAVEVANEGSKQAHALIAAALGREWVTKQKVERAKAALLIYEEIAKKLTITLVVLGVMFLVLLILSTRFREVKIRQMCLP